MPRSYSPRLWTAPGLTLPMNGMWTRRRVFATPFLRAGPQPAHSKLGQLALRPAYSPWDNAQEARYARRLG